MPHGTGGARVGEQPWPGFDEMSVEEIVEYVQERGKGDASLPARVLAYEKANQNRDDVINAMVNWNS